MDPVKPIPGVRGQTMAEKLLSRAASLHVYAGDIAICEPDMAMGTDGSVPMALEYLRDMQPDATLIGPVRPDRIIFALDHYGVASGEQAMLLQAKARSYARLFGVHVFDVAEGIGHQLMLETGLVLPGQLVVGADSHAVSYGALNAFGSGIGSSDLAGILQCAQVWLKVPASVRIRLTGKLPPYASAKDLALTMARTIGAGGANYMALEFDGPGLASLDMDDRIVLANMSVEMGAKAGIFPYDACTGAWLAGRSDAPFEPVSADADARYAQTLTFHLDDIVPLVALPHRVDNVVELHAAGDTRIDMVYLGTCTGGRLKDYVEALSVLRASGGVAPGVRLIVTPASASIHAEMEARGMLDEFVALGAEVQPPGCGSCCGTCGTIPADGEHVISTANRNFRGRMGNRQAEIFLASPRTCAAAAVTGRLTDPRESSL